MKKRLRECGDYIGLLRDYIDSELPEEMQKDFKRHIEECDRCWMMFRTYNLTVTLSKKAGRIRKISKEQHDRLCSLISSRLCSKDK
jgi:hypothetical protein